MSLQETTYFGIGRPGEHLLVINTKDPANCQPRQMPSSLNSMKGDDKSATLADYPWVLTCASLGKYFPSTVQNTWLMTKNPRPVEDFNQHFKRNTGKFLFVSY